MAEAATIPPSRLSRFFQSWATRSLIIGAVGAGVDIAVTNVLVLHFHFSWRMGAMTGLAIGGAVNFILNRFLAFHEHTTDFVSPMVRFAALTAVQSVIHGQVVVMIRSAITDVTWPSEVFHWQGAMLEGAKLTFAKVVADILVFSLLHLVMLRYVIFPKKKTVASDAS
ncbi:MAG: GtrA family protein [Myxococcaceae bacterium]|nr:GtrA family protein [Myxococcaceae bacterium]